MNPLLFPDYLAGIATALLAVIAGVDLWRGLAERSRHKRSLTARRTAEAFMLRRQVLSWLGQEPFLKQGLVGWVRLTRHHKTFARHMEEAERRMQELLELTAELGAGQAEVGKAHQEFLHATNLLTYFDAVDPSDHRRPVWERSFAEAEENLRSVVDALEGRLIPTSTLRAAASVKRIEAVPVEEADS